MFQNIKLENFYIHLYRFTLITNDMKRLMIFFAAVLLAGQAFGQSKVQDTFYGIEIRSDYDEFKSNPEFKELLKEKYRNNNWMYRHAYDWADNRRERVRFTTMSFGGRKWDYCEYFFDENKTFYQIRFYNGTIEPEPTRNTYDLLLKDLNRKYSGQPGITVTEDTDWDDDQSLYVTYSGDNGMTCELRYSYEASRSGNMFYYVFLYYYDQGLKEEAQNAWFKEL